MSGSLASMWRAALRGLAREAPVRTFVAEGADAPAVLDALALRDEIRFVDTPRSATILLVAGRLPASLHESVKRAHDAMPHPRATAWCTRTPDDVLPDVLPGMVRVIANVDDAGAGAALLAAALLRVQRELIDGGRPSDPDSLPDEDPAPWRGVGPFGQGGAGMTGGVPYGRPLAERAPDRDGLDLDQLPVRVGPFFPPLPSGLVLDVKLQGDIVQEVTVPGNAFARAGDMPIEEQPVLVAALERARARHHLRWLAYALRAHGLCALGRRALAVAVAIGRGDPAADADAEALLVRVERLLRGYASLSWATRGVGRLSPGQTAGKGCGPVARACGLAEDARAADPAYQALGFVTLVQPVTDDTGDARARWRQRIGETRQSLDLARRAGRRRAGEEGAPVEGVRGRVASGPDTREPSATLLALLPDLLRGLEWGDAVTTIVSLDVDVRDAAYGAGELAPQAPPPTADGGMGGMDGMDHAMGDMSGMTT